jgi:DNA polymerase III delta prime subunit
METSQRNVVIICSCTRDVAKNEAKDCLRNLSEFAKLTANTNMIVMCVPHHFDLQPSSYINKEVETFNRKLQKTMKTFSHMHVCSISTKTDHFTSHGLHLNSQRKNWIINKWSSIITPIVSKSTVISVTPLPWTEKSDNSYDEQEHRKELVPEGTNMTKEKHSISKEEIFYSAPELEVGSEYSEEEELLKETPVSPISKTSNQCKIGDDEDAKYIVPKME